MDMMERTVNVERVEDLIAVFGSFDENINRIEDSLGVSIVNRDMLQAGDYAGIEALARAHVQAVADFQK